MTLRYACTILVATLISALVATPAARAQNIVSVEPSSAEAGTTTPFTIEEDGECYFSLTGSTVSFDPATGITHEEVVLQGDNINIISTTINIPADTTPGLQTVTVSTSGIDCVGVDMFEVTSADSEAIIRSVTPDHGYTGQQVLDVVVIGEGTHFDESSVLSFSPAGITVQPLAQEPDPTVLEATISIDVDATLGPRSVLVTTGDEEASGDDLFSVVETPVDVSPDSGTQGQTLPTVIVTGGSTVFTTVLEVDLGEGIAVDDRFDAPDDVTLVLSDVAIDAVAPVGWRDLTLETTGGQRVYSKVFAVYQGPDTLLLSIFPVHGDRGHPGLAVELVGQNTHFDAIEVKVSFSGDGVRATPGSAADSTHLTARLEIADSADEGQRDVSVQAGGACEWRMPAPCEMVGLDSAFTVTPPGTIDSADPAVVAAGGDVTVALSATDGWFVQDQTSLVVDPPDGIEVLSVIVQGADQLQVDLRIDDDAPGEPRDVRAVTGTEVAVGLGIIDVDNPQILKLTPGAGYQGQSALPLRITGIDIPFSTETLVAFSGQGVTVDEVDFFAAEPDELTVVVSIAEDAPTGPRDLTVTAGAIEVTAKGIFTVAARPEPEEGGCGCAAAHRSSAGSLFLLLALWGLRGLRTSRRRRP